MTTYHYLCNAAFFPRAWSWQLRLPGLECLAEASDLTRADSLVVHLPSILSANAGDALRKLRRVVPDRQVWVCESLESAAFYPQLEDPEFMAMFDLEASYRQSADIWTPYLPVSLADGRLERPPGQRGKLCCAFISSPFDGSGRQAFAAALMRQMRVDSFGRYRRNSKLWFDRGVTTKLRVMRRYRFTLAFENSIRADYVTEKFFQPLEAGTIPVYLGAPNVDEFAPGENCYIDASDFSSPGDLASFLQEADPAEFHRWRGRPLKPSFAEKVARIQRPWQDRLAGAIRDIVESRR